MKPRLSVIILAKNEQQRIGKCLTSAAFADERIVVDNGSTDRTIEIARQQGASVYEEHGKDFSGIRELGLLHAAGKWVLYIDADEEIRDALREEIQKVIRTYKNGKPEVYRIKRDTYYLGYHWPYKDKVERLFLRASLKGWHGRLHETPVYAGTLGELTHPLIHRTHRTLEEMLTKTNDWSEIEAKLRMDVHHPPVTWWRLLRVMCTGFLQSYIEQRGWRAGIVGLIESIYQAFSMFITYAKLWEMQRNKK